MFSAGAFPGVTASSLRSRFKAKNFEGSSSNQDKVDGGAEVNQPPPRRKAIVFKKRKTESTLSGDMQGKDENVRLDDLSSFLTKQQRLHVFEEEGESSSVWSQKFPFNIVADEVVQTVTDVRRVEEVGDIGVDQFLQVSVVLVCFCCCFFFLLNFDMWILGVGVSASFHWS